MRGKVRVLPLLVMAVAVGLYLLNSLWLKGRLPPPLEYFFLCYFNDVLAGGFFLAFMDVWLGLWGFLPLRPLWKQGALLLCAGVVWELGPLLWKPWGVPDPWDVPAYLAGGIGYVLLGQIGGQKKREEEE